MCVSTRTLPHTRNPAVQAVLAFAERHSAILQLLALPEVCLCFLPASPAPFMIALQIFFRPSFLLSKVLPGFPLSLKLPSLSPTHALFS